MSGPPHHSHNRQPPPGNPAWNHLQTTFQVPNFFPRQPQHAHMSNEHHLTLHQPTWHTPTTEPAMKTIAALPHVFNLDQMLTERSYRAGVDLTLTRNGNQNGDVPTGPISLSVRDTNKINSLPPGALGIQSVELTKSLSPGLKSLSPGLKSNSPGLKSNSPGVIKPMSPALSTSPGLQDSPKNTNKKKRMDSVLEKLNTTVEKNEVEKTLFEIEREKVNLEKQQTLIEKSLEKPLSVLVQGANDENSNSSSTINAPTPTNDELLVSPYSNEDSLDSNKSRRKRKPSKTVRVTKELSEKPEEKEIETVAAATEDAVDGKIDEKIIENEPEEVPPAKKPRRKTSSESETIEKIASMVQEVVQNQEINQQQENKDDNQVLGETLQSNQFIERDQGKIINEEGVQVQGVEKNQRDSKVCEKGDENRSNIDKGGEIKEIDGKNENKMDESCKEIDQQQKMSIDIPVLSGVVTAAQRKATNFVEVENKLEEMFAGIVEDPLPKPEEDPKSSHELQSNQIINQDLATSTITTSKLETATTAASEEITSTNNDENALLSIEDGDDLCKTPVKKGKLSSAAKRRANTNATPKKKKGSKAAKVASSKTAGSGASSSSSRKDKKSINGKIEVIKDVYAYDSGSNTSSVKSRGPFVHIEGTRDSPVSVSIINTPTEEDNEKKNNKLKKFHDDSEYRHKVRSKGLHCSTLSNKYDAQTKDVSWICVFCKRGPHSTDVSLLLSHSNQFYPPGDLFGPYVITNNCPEFERKLNDPYDKQFKSKKIARVLDAQNALVTAATTATVAQTTKTSSKKSKRKHQQQQHHQQLLGAVDVSGENKNKHRDFLHDDFLLGITATSEKTFEIWTHEDCVVWSPGVYLVGPKIVGLEEAVWTSCNVTCVKCGFKGANLCCLRRGCTNVVHFGCGVVADWALDYDSFRAYCVEHKSIMC